MAKTTALAHTTDSGLTFILDGPPYYFCNVFKVFRSGIHITFPGDPKVGFKFITEFRC